LLIRHSKLGNTKKYVLIENNIAYSRKITHIDISAKEINAVDVSLLAFNEFNAVTTSKFKNV